tara:strand:+ start:504 stop:638 length:135 start_codon:yes stop_codon:yes gene_type:complete
MVADVAAVATLIVQPTVAEVVRESPPVGQINGTANMEPANGGSL